MKHTGKEQAFLEFKTSAKLQNSSQCDNGIRTDLYINGKNIQCRNECSHICCGPWYATRMPRQMKRKRIAFSVVLFVCFTQSLTRVSKLVLNLLCSPGCPQSHKCWDCRNVPPYPTISTISKSLSKHKQKTGPVYFYLYFFISKGLFTGQHAKRY